MRSGNQRRHGEWVARGAALAAAPVARGAAPRGIAVDPAARCSSIDAIAAALTPPPRSRWLAAAAGRFDAPSDTVYVQIDGGDHRSTVLRVDRGCGRIGVGSPADPVVRSGSSGAT